MKVSLLLAAVGTGIVAAAAGDQPSPVVSGLLGAGGATAVLTAWIAALRGDLNSRRNEVVAARAETKEAYEAHLAAVREFRELRDLAQKEMLDVLREHTATSRDMVATIDAGTTSLRMDIGARIDRLEAKIEALT